jgi:hypothetical protein
MKTFVTLTVIALLFMSLVFLGMPMIIEKETVKVNSEVQGLTAKVQALEKFRKDQEGAWKLSGLKHDADPQKIVKAVNSLSTKTGNLEAVLGARMSSVEDSLKAHGALNEDALRKQAENMESLNKELLKTRQQVFLNSIITNITVHIMNAKLELASKNIGSVKAELQTIAHKLQQAKNIVEDKDKKSFEDLKAMVENIRTELDVSVSAANNMINLLWYELDKALGIL